MRQQANPTRRELVLKWAMGATTTLWAAYVFHSEVVGQGIVGWITDVAVQRYGSVSENTALGIAMLIGILPIGLVFQLIAWGLGIRLLKRRRRGELPAGTPSQIRRNAVLGGVGILAAAARHHDHRQQRRRCRSTSTRRAQPRRMARASR